MLSILLGDSSGMFLAYTWRTDLMNGCVLYGCDALFRDLCCPVDLLCLCSLMVAVNVERANDSSGNADCDGVLVFESDCNS
jgi:hypothetical protein